MTITPIKTRRFELNQDLLDFLKAELPPLKEKQIVCVTSKIIALAEGAVRQTVDKHALVREVADYYLEPTESKYGVMLTVKDSILAVNAGIDQSNIESGFVLLPSDSFAWAAKIWQFLKDEYQLKQLGVVVTDSKTFPLKWGTVGTALGCCGFEPLYDCIGQPDLYGKPMQMTKMNVMEAVAVAAVLEMGETAESQPLCIVEEVSKLEFRDAPLSQSEIDELLIEIEDDVYGPVLGSVGWKQKL